MLRKILHPKYGGIVNSPHYHQINAFVESIEKNKKLPILPEEALKVVKIYEQIANVLYQ